MPAPHQALVRRAIEEIWNTGQLDIADLLFAPDYVNHGGLIPDLVQGPEAIKISVVLYRRAFPGLHITLEDLRTTGKLVTLRWTARSSRPVGRCTCVERSQPDGVTGITRIHCRHGQIVESWTDWDRASVPLRTALTMFGITER